MILFYIDCLQSPILHFKSLVNLPIEMPNSIKIVFTLFALLSLATSLVQKIPLASSLKRGTKLKAVSFNIAEVTIADQLKQFQPEPSLTDPSNDPQNIAIIMASIGYFIYLKRPRGSANTELLDIRRSTVVNADLGVFATRFIAKDTLVGKYPGFVKGYSDALAKKNDDEARQRAQKYMWELSNDVYLDPTNKEGKLDRELKYLFGLIKVDTTMARMNEPPPGGDTNVYCEVVGADLDIYAERDIFADEELFVDYGSRYDREDYAETSTKRLEETPSTEVAESSDAIVQPIISSVRDSPISTDNLDTSLPGSGFISKLNKSSSVKGNGLLDPEEAAGLFREMGATGLFGSDEDKEIIRSMLGKDSKNPQRRITSTAGDNLSKDSSAQYDTSSKSVGAFEPIVVEGRSKGGAGGDEDAKFLEALLGIGRGRDDPASEIKTMQRVSDAADGDDAGVEMEDEETMDEQLQKLLAFKSEQRVRSVMSPSISITSSSVSDSVAPSDTVAPAKATREDVLELQQQLDRLTDEQLEMVMGKVKAAMASKMTQQVITPGVEEKKKISKLMGGFKKMPRADVVDPSARQAYETELSRIEDELEQLYNDPLRVWQDLAALEGELDDSVPAADDDLTG